MMNSGADIDVGDDIDTDNVNDVVEKERLLQASHNFSSFPESY